MGICIQQWENYTCDCSMTSYTGTQCNDRKSPSVPCSFHILSFFCSVHSLFSGLDNLNDSFYERWIEHAVIYKSKCYTNTNSIWMHKISYISTHTHTHTHTHTLHSCSEDQFGVDKGTCCSLHFDAGWIWCVLLDIYLSCFNINICVYIFVYIKYIVYITLFKIYIHFF